MLNIWMCSQESVLNNKFECKKIIFWGKSYKLESQVFYPKNKIESILEEKSIIAENPQR
jgi:hypothetical protein